MAIRFPSLIAGIATDNFVGFRAIALSAFLIGSCLSTNSSRAFSTASPLETALFSLSLTKSRARAKSFSPLDDSGHRNSNNDLATGEESVHGPASVYSSTHSYVDSLQPSGDTRKHEDYEILRVKRLNFLPIFSTPLLSAVKKRENTVVVRMR